MYKWTDPDTGIVYEILYIVTQGDEGPEHFVYKIAGDDHEWVRLPPFALDPEVARLVSEHFFG